MQQRQLESCQLLVALVDVAAEDRMLLDVLIRLKAIDPSLREPVNFIVEELFTNMVKYNARGGSDNVTALVLRAERQRLIASNIANADTVSSSIDQTYRARHPVFATVFQGAQGSSGDSLFQNQDAAIYTLKERMP